MKRLIAAVACIGALLITPTSGVAADEQLPNLQPVHPIGLALYGEDASLSIGFDGVIANAGTHALEVVAVPTGAGQADAQQCVRWQGLLCEEYAPPQHSALELSADSSLAVATDRCWKLRDLMRYELRTLMPDGRPSTGEPLRTVTSSKFIEDGVPFRRDVPATERPGTHRLCHLIQGLSAGWAYRWHDDMKGQQIPIAGLPDGQYALVTIVNPKSALQESNYSDNVVWVVLEIYRNGTRVRFLGGA